MLNKQIRFVELKTQTGILSERQKVVFRDLEDAGFPVTIIRSKSDVENFIQGLTDEIATLKEIPE